MQVKVIGENGAERIFECSHIVKTDRPDCVEIELCYHGNKPSVVVNLPRDGHTAYTMSNEGGTTGKYTWPSRERRAS